MSGDFNKIITKRPKASPVSPAKNAITEIESNKRKNPKNIFARKFCCCISCNFSMAFCCLLDSLYSSVSNPWSGHVAFPSQKNLSLTSPSFF